MALRHQNAFFAYRQNLMLTRAVKRDLEIIGEAINIILTRDSGFLLKITNAKSIISLRNQVIQQVVLQNW